MSDPLPHRPGLPPLLALEYVGTSLKETNGNLQFPFFTPSDRPTRGLRRYADKHGNFIEMWGHPELGLPTIHDQDVLIYCVTTLAACLNAGQKISRHFRMTTADVLQFAHRGLGGAQYDRLEQSLMRISSTRLRTNINRGEVIETAAFGLVDQASFRRRRSGGALLGCEFVLSEWLFAAICRLDVRTLHEDYFRLRAFDRALYQLIRWHMDPEKAGSKWHIGMITLQNKIGSASPRRQFRRMMRNAVQRHADWEHGFEENIKRWNAGDRIGIDGEPMRVEPMLFPEYQVELVDGKDETLMRVQTRVERTLPVEKFDLTKADYDEAATILGPNHNPAVAYMVWRNWAAAKPGLARYPTAAFLGFCKEYARRRRKADEEDRTDGPAYGAPVDPTALEWWTTLSLEQQVWMEREYRMARPSIGAEYPRTDAQMIEVAHKFWSRRDWSDVRWSQLGSQT